MVERGWQAGKLLFALLSLRPFSYTAEEKKKKTALAGSFFLVRIDTLPHRYIYMYTELSLSCFFFLSYAMPHSLDPFIREWCENSPFFYVKTCAGEVIPTQTKSNSLRKDLLWRYSCPGSLDGRQRQHGRKRWRRTLRGAVGGPSWNSTSRRKSSSALPIRLCIF